MSKKDDVNAERITSIILAHQDKAHERMRFKNMLNWLLIGVTIGLAIGMMITTIGIDRGWLK